jgi:hypothetical protein
MVPHLHVVRRFFGWLIKRKKHAVAAATVAGLHFFIMALSSMAGPHQLQFIATEFLLGSVLVLIAAF